MSQKAGKLLYVTDGIPICRSNINQQQIGK